MSFTTLSSLSAVSVVHYMCIYWLLYEAHLFLHIRLHKIDSIFYLRHFWKICGPSWKNNNNTNWKKNRSCISIIHVGPDSILMVWVIQREKTHAVKPPHRFLMCPNVASLFTLAQNSNLCYNDPQTVRYDSGDHFRHFGYYPGNTITIEKCFLNISEKLDVSWNVEFFKGFLLSFLTVLKWFCM